MINKVFIRELTVLASIGVYDWERTIKQQLVFNIEMAWDFTQAVANDDAQYCLDYAQVSQAVIEFATSRHFGLVETLAYQLAEKLKQQFGISQLTIELHKPKAVAEAGSVGVIVQC